MIIRILSSLGLPYKETRFLNAPKSTYAIYHDYIERSGGDNINLLTRHDITLELYEYAPDPNAEIALEGELDTRGVNYTKQARYWIQEEQLYQVIYEFSYFVKED